MVRIRRSIDASEHYSIAKMFSLPNSASSSVANLKTVRANRDASLNSFDLVSIIIMRPSKFLEMDADRRIWWGADGNNTPRIKRFLSEVKQGVVPQTIWVNGDVGNTQEEKEVVGLFGAQKTS